jgi:hypothetical protein
VVGRIKRGDDMTKPGDEVKCLIDIAGLAKWIFDFNIDLDIEIHYV